MAGLSDALITKLSTNTDLSIEQLVEKHYATDEQKATFPEIKAFKEAIFLIQPNSAL